MKIFRKPARVPVILQSESSECGLACMAMILCNHGRQADTDSLRKTFSTSSRGVTLRRLVDIARHMGLAARPLRVEIEYVPELRLPCILHWGLLHYVVLVEVNRDAYIVHDPSRGRRVVRSAEFSRLFTGVAVEFDELGPPRLLGPRGNVSWIAFFRKVRGIRIELGAILSLAILLEALQILAPFYLQFTVDWVVGRGDLEIRNVLLTAFLAVLLSQVAASLLRSAAVLRLGAKMHATWLTDLFAHALRLPLAFFERRYLSELLGRFEGVAFIQRVLTTGFLEMFLDGLMSVSLLGIMYAFNSRLALLSTASIVIALLVRYPLLGRLREALREFEIVHSRQQGYFLETVRSMRSIKLFCAEGLRLARWANLVQRRHSRHMAAERIQTFFRLSNVFIFGLERLFVIWYATGLVVQRSLSLGMLFTYIAYREMLAARVTNFLDKFVEAKAAEIHLSRLADVVLAEPEPDGALKEFAPDQEPVQIVFSEIWFRYSDDDPWILKNVSGVLHSGATIAITGPSGCGKSTLLKILQGLLPPTKGSVTVNGAPVGHFPQAYRKIIGAVNQEDELFMGTIAENIAFFDSPLDSERVEFAASQASIHDDIRNMPMRYHTVITDSSSGLSGGQKQRLLLARALYKQPRVLFLDEATSHLDVKMEQSILDRVKQFPMTRVIVAHRPETISACENVWRLDGGILDAPLRVS
jgi:ATP-binding cassette subfamily B protein RaxB